MYFPHSLNVIPQQRPDKYTRRLTAFIDNLFQSFGLQELDYRNRFEEGRKEISVTEGILKRSQYLPVGEKNLLSEYLIYFLILIGFIFFITRLQEGKK